jgi:ATP-binding cassette subfamily B (MDR/TAP) protein 1
MVDLFISTPYFSSSIANEEHVVRTERIVQQALDRVSQNRTTVVIAHRLSTIKTANKIVVLRMGQMVEEGTHEELLEIDNGVYHGLVRAQALSMGHEDLENEIITIDDEQSHDTDKDGVGLKTTLTTIVSENVCDSRPETEYKTRGFFNSFGLIILEQSSHWMLYTLILFAAVGAACK